jgi:chromosome condensin MukBEF ATPase and DNA-binding subunit MukB
MVDLINVLTAVAARLRDLERELPETPGEERDRLAQEIEAGEQLLERYARKARRAPVWRQARKTVARCDRF